MPAAPNVTTTELALLLDMTTRRVRRLGETGVVTRARDCDGTPLHGRYVLLDSVRGYIQYLRTLRNNRL
jgi:hypothetical protein